MSPYLVKCEDAAFGYSPCGPAVVSGCGLLVTPGDFLVLRGPNGGGKSTVVKGLLGLVPTVSGSVFWGIDKARIGYVPQEKTIDDDLPFTAVDIIKCALPTSWRRSEQSAFRALDQVELGDKAGIRFGRLSGGQKRRVLLARALAMDPLVLFLDEPTANVDSHSEVVIGRVIDSLRRDKATAVVGVAHDEKFGAQARIVRIEGGMVHA